MASNNEPIAKRTRNQWSNGSGSARRKRNRETVFTHEVIDLDDHDDYWIESRSSNTAKKRDSSHLAVKEVEDKMEAPTKTNKHTYFVYLDDSDEDDEEADEDLQTSSKLHHGSEDHTTKKQIDQSPMDESHDVKISAKGKAKVHSGTVKEEESDNEETDEDLEENATTEDKSFSSSESESDDSDDSDFSPENKPENKNRYLKRSESVDQKQKDDSDVLISPTTRKQSSSEQKFKMKKIDQNPIDHVPSVTIQEEESDTEDAKFVTEDDEDPQKNMKASSSKSIEDDEDEPSSSSESETDDSTNVDEKQNADPIKHEKSELGRQRDGVDAILDSIISDEDVNDKKEDYCIPYKFKFDDSEDESINQNTDERVAESLFQEMDFAQTCEEIGSSTTPKVENTESDGYYDDIDACERGKHGDVYLDEQIGLRCYQCGAILVESKYVIPLLATYAPNRSRTRRHLDEQHSSSGEGLFFMDSDSDHVEICKQSKGTVWELVPASVQARMYPHQKEGFEFLWKNLAGTIELSELQTPSPCGGGGCIISHAPGTGKTFLTIVFIESFLKKFPKCRPVIVAPAGMLLTWEAELEKWEVGFSFINLHNTELLRKEVIIGGSRRNKDLIRAMKIRSWVKGGSVLGLSYSLYEKLAGDSSKKIKNHERIRAFLLEKPGLVVLDEGHTPRNQSSKIWNTILKLETKNRVILSGTPFQNNFRELFNTMRIVRPETAKGIEKEKFYVDMIQSKSMKKSEGRSKSEDIEKLKGIISPFVHVHKGHILESKLPGLKQSVILLNPPPFQRRFIENLGNSASTFEYEHKAALVSVHPSLILHCLQSEKEKKAINKQELEDVRLEPEFGVKTRFVMELIRLSLALNEKVLIFSQYIQPSELLQDQIANAFGWVVEKEIARIKGKTHQTHRQKIINIFNDPTSELKVLLASTKCCSEGIHLHGASQVVLLDVVWNPSVEKQAISRAYRLGQKKVVYTYHLMTAGTTEEEKYDRQVEKGRVAEMVFSSASMAAREPKKKVTVADQILQQMVDHKELKDIFKKIRYPEN